jgi:hypothetical protein
MMLANFKAFLNGIDGQSIHKSEYGHLYMTIAFKTLGEIGDRAPLLKLENALIRELMIARMQGAQQIIWRWRPKFEYEDGFVVLRCRLHFLPDIREGLTVRPEGEAILEIAA